VSEQRHLGRIEMKQPNRLNRLVGSGADRSYDPAKEGGVPHFDGDEQHLVEREEHRNLQPTGRQPAIG